MDFKEKYLKYKTKYLQLKKQIGGRRVITKPNSGQVDGMINQCFWISLVDYLRVHGFPDLTVRQLREQATSGGRLIINGEREMLDTFIHTDVVEQIASYYNLTIRGFPVDGNGNMLYDGLFHQFGNGPNIVEIANFGLYHFQLITGYENGGNNKFVPLVPFKNNLKKLTDIDPKIREKYKLISEYQGELQIIENLFKEDKLEWDRNYKLSFDMRNSKDINEDERTIILNQYNSFLEKLDSDMSKKHERMETLKNEIASLQLVIQIYENEH